MLFNLKINAFLLCFFLNFTTELTILQGTPTKEAKEKMQTNPVIIKTKKSNSSCFISCKRQLLVSSVFYSKVKTCIFFSLIFKIIIYF